MAGVAHLAEAGHEEVVAAVIGGRVLLDVGELHELPSRRGREGNARERRPAGLLTFEPGDSAPQGAPPPPPMLKPGEQQVPRAAPSPGDRWWPASQSALVPNPAHSSRLHNKTGTRPSRPSLLGGRAEGGRGESEAGPLELWPPATPRAAWRTDTGCEERHRRRKSPPSSEHAALPWDAFWEARTTLKFS